MKEEDTASELPPEWFIGLNEGDCTRIDVRPILARGTDPLELILENVAQLSPDDVLLIEAPFDPLPLRRLMAGRGYDSYGVQLSDQHWQVFFMQQEIRHLPELPDLPVFPMQWRDGLLEMDLRGLTPPNPMIAILKIIENSTGGDDFMVRLMRDPIYLHPELVSRHWRADVVEESDDGLMVRIKKEHEQ